MQQVEEKDDLTHSGPGCVTTLPSPLFQPTLSNLITELWCYCPPFRIPPGV